MSSFSKIHMYSIKNRTKITFWMKTNSGSSYIKSAIRFGRYSCKRQICDRKRVKICIKEWKIVKIRILVNSIKSTTTPIKCHVNLCAVFKKRRATFNTASFLDILLPSSMCLPSYNITLRFLVVSFSIFFLWWEKHDTFRGR